MSNGGPVKAEHLAPSLQDVLAMPEDQKRDGKLDDQEKKALSYLTSVSHQPDAFNQAFNRLVQQDGRFKGKGKEFKNILLTSLQLLSNQKEEQREQALYNTTSKLRELRLKVEGKDVKYSDTLVSPEKAAEQQKNSGIEIDVPPPYNDKSKYVYEVNSGVTYVKPAPQGGGDALSRIDGSTLIAAVGFAGLSLSAIASMSGGGNSQAVALAMGALASGNYIKNQMVGESLPDSDKEIDALSKKYGVDKAFVKNITDKSSEYHALFGKHVLNNEFAYAKFPRSLNRKMLNSINADRLQSAQVNADRVVGSWNDKMTLAQKRQWLQLTLDQSTEGHSDVKDLIKEGGVYDKVIQEDPSVLTVMYKAITWMDEKGIHTKKRQNALKGIGKEIDDGLDPSVLAKLTRVEALNN